METATHLLIFLAVGLVAGWIASVLVRGKGLGLLGDLIVGVVGALIGGLIFRGLGISAGNLLGELISATFGAIVLLIIVRLLKKA